MKACYNCTKELDLTGRISRTEQCPFCRSDLHCCRSCSLFDPAKSSQCREPAAEPVREKTKANHCDYFIFRENSSAPNDASRQNARKEFEALFRTREKTARE